MAVNPGKRMVILMSNEITIQDVFNGANSVIKYPGRYTHRIAISNRRIISMTSETVTYLAKDYKNDGKMISYTVKGTEF